MIQTLLLVYLLICLVLPVTPAGMAEARYADAAGWCVWFWAWGAVAVAAGVVGKALCEEWRRRRP